MAPTAPSGYSLVELDGKAAYRNNSTGQFMSIGGVMSSPAPVSPSRAEIIPNDAPTLEIPEQTQTYEAASPVASIVNAVSNVFTPTPAADQYRASPAQYNPVILTRIQATRSRVPSNTELLVGAAVVGLLAIVLLRD